MSEARGRGYSSKQIAATVIVLSAVAIFVLIQTLRYPAYVSDPQPAIPPHAKDLADRIDLNQADLATLSALPMVGEKRAREIIEYRTRIQSGDSAKVVFRHPDDLLRLRGFGSAMVNQLEPYLLFPTTAPATTQTGE